MAPLLNKTELAKKLGRNRVWLDARLKKDPDFPVEERRRGVGGWKFDWEKVQAHLGLKEVPAATSKSSAKEKAGADGGEKPYNASSKWNRGKMVADHVGEATARQQRDQMQALMLEDKLRISRGELIEREPAVLMLSHAMAEFGRGLDTLPERIAKKFNMPEGTVPVMRAMCDDLRHTMVKNLRDILGES